MSRPPDHSGFRRAKARRGAPAGTALRKLDPVPDRGAFLALFDPPPVPTLVFCGNATPPKSKAEKTALGEQPGIDLSWMSGSLGLNEEYPQAIADPILRFVNASQAELTGATAAYRPVSAARL
jgi:hypothetical protein